MAEMQTIKHDSSDPDTQEALLYGSSYPDVKAIEIELDRCMEITGKRIGRLYSCLDTGLAMSLLQKHWSLVFSDEKISILPEIEGHDPESITKAIWTLREVGYYKIAAGLMADTKNEAIRAGKLIGDCEHSVYTQARHSDAVRKLASNKFGQKNMRP